MDDRSYYSTMLKVHLAQLNNDYSASERLLLNHMPVLDRDSIYLVATWLWNLQNHLKKDKESANLRSLQIDPYVTFLVENWKNPFDRVWNDGRIDIHVSNIGMVHAALLETKNNSNQYALQKTITEIRDFVFDSLLSGGMLLNALEDREVSPDIQAAVLPYGLFSPEDLIVVESVAQIEKQLTTKKGVFEASGQNRESSAATAWLSLYFLEKGNLDKANTYLEMARKLQTKQACSLGEVLIEIIKYYQADTFRELQIIHKPYGNENIYEPQLTERNPHYPAVDEPTRVACQVWPAGEEDQILLTVRSDGDEIIQCSEMNKKYIQDKDVSVWAGQIMPLKEQKMYTYEFTAYKSGEKLVNSEPFAFELLKRRSLENITLYKKSENEVVLICSDEEGFSLQLNLGFIGNEFYFHFDGVIKEEGDHVEHNPKEVSIGSRANELTLDIITNPFSVEIKKSNVTILKSHDFLSFIDCTTDGKLKIRDLTLHFNTPADERFYGFGERYNEVEQRGNIIDCYVYNQYRDQGTRTYMPVPFYMSSLGYGLAVNTNRYTKFDLAHSLKDALSITARLSEKEQKLSLSAFFGTPKEIIQDFTSKTGKPVLPPVWSFGPWMSSNNWDRDTVVRAEVEKTNQYKIPATVLVLEQWSDETTYYMFNDAQYEVKPGEASHSYEEMDFPEWGRWPNPRELIDYLHDNGLKVLLWQIPIQKYLNRQTHPQKDIDERYMIEKGFIVKKADGTPYRMPEGWFKESLLMDFSNEQGKEWWFNKRKYLLEIGVDGFKTDGGEFVFGENLIFADGKKGDEMRNLYPNDYIEAYYEFATTYRKGDAMTFSRAGYMGAQNFPAHWAGDERSTFEAFRRSLAAGISSGMSGIPFWGWDLAGFNGDIPSAELFVRSAAMAAFCPIMQYHAESKGEFNQDRTPWNIAERTKQSVALEGYRFYANVRMNLLPYIWNEAKRTSESGIPLMRSLFMEYPEDPRAEGVFDQYLFGSSLMVAPVTEEGAASRMVYFPKGKWFDLWSGESIIGPAFQNVHSPLTHIPVYVKSGSVILLNADDSLELGSWVSNDISRYVKPVLRLYLENGVSENITDHLNNQWNVRITEELEHWNVKIEGPALQYNVKIPEGVNPQGKKVFINGEKLT
ncbi:glycoside hydrolase family 31 protein [Bacillus sp. V3-13]|uniref:glycoside hydrolase family 31 protein n=1 Tax=Bacillus sp. V3-13 TaxID=2053728 RepID=UPI0015E0634E|nr:TIM-barrel domain-containing protein [Bacillus sp. V3-13]